MYVSVAHQRTIHQYRIRYTRYDTPYLCLKKAGGSVPNTSTSGRSTTTNSPSAMKSTSSKGLYCVIILTLCSHCPVSCFSGETSFVLRRFREDCWDPSRLILQSQVAPQNTTYFWEEGEAIGAKATPTRASCIVVKRRGRWLVSS